MKILIVLAIALCAVHANPIPDNQHPQNIDLVKIPLEGDKELDIITLADSGDSSINERNKRTIGILRELFPTLSQITTNEDVNSLDSIGLARLNDRIDAIRVVRETAAEAASEQKDADQSVAESTNANQSPALDELTLDSDENDENRNKRFLSFGGSAGSGASSGGSGNFLFDIIRLVSGGSGTEQSDEKAHSPDSDSGDLGKGDGYTEGIPGPVTRLFVLANRGLSNLIQDLILRIAQTSERVVNFKARLITSLI